MKLFKTAVILLLITFFTASCTVIINYPENGVVDYLTGDNDSQTSPNEVTKSATEGHEPEITPQETIPKPNETEAITEDSVITETTTDETDACVQQIRLTEFTSPISRNHIATISIVGSPYTEYSIDVYYSTVKSTAKGLEAKMSDDAGAVSWSWKIGPSVKEGNYKIVITGSGASLETEIQIY